MIRNPILPGFQPDPSILRVGDDFYVATSTFEWCPGVLIHHSRDLVHWRTLGGALPALDLSGVPDSGGVWAPDLTYHDGLFHLVYSVVDNYAFGYKDLRNFLVTAPSIDGPWSAPTPLHGRGFDASLFHDPESGESWLLNMVFDSRLGHGFAGIEAQRLEGGKLVGEPRTILHDRGITEGPHIYRREGWYYLMTADGGTGYEHGVTVARSRDLAGPYETDPVSPMMTARHDPCLALQKAGHGCLVETPGGEWYLAHLAARPHTVRGRCVLGRETALQRVEWVDGWPRVAGGVPSLDVPAPDLPPSPWPPQETWSTLRRPASPDWIVTEGSRARIQGGQSPHGLRAPSLYAHRMTAERCALRTTMEFRPGDVHQSAGVTAYYNTRNWHYLSVGPDGLTLTTSDRGARTVQLLLSDPPPRLALGVERDGAVLRFSCDTGDGWTVLREADATILSDENADEFVDGQVRVFGFTGAFLGLWVQDLSAEGCHAEFDEIVYEA